MIACRLLAWLDERSAAITLARALEEAEDDGLVWEAAKGLIRLRAAEAAPTLLRVLNEGTPTKQMAAAYALGWLRVQDTIPALRAMATNSQREDAVREHAIEALGVLGAGDAVADLIALLSSQSPTIRYWTAYALGQIGDAASIPALEQIAQYDDAVLGPPYRENTSVKGEALDAIRGFAKPGRETNDQRSNQGSSARIRNSSNSSSLI